MTYGDEVLFDPSWGVYDMAVGKNVVSAFAGPADDKSFKNLHKKSETVAQKIKYSQQDLALHQQYALLRDMRHGLNDPETPLNSDNLKTLSDIWFQGRTNYPNEWLLFLELLELMIQINHPSQDQVKAHLEGLTVNPDLSPLIKNGLALM